MKKPPVTLYSFESNRIRTIELNDEPWFVAQDICAALNIQNVTQAIERLDDDERSMFNIGRQGAVNIVSESGMYTLVLRCRDAVNKGTVPHRFRKWVTNEVLPAIRKKGSYSTGLSEEDLCDLCWLWKYNSAMIEAAYAVWPILHAAEHRLAGQYASFKTDYLHHARNTRKVLEKATSHIEWNMWRTDNWRVLSSIRERH